MRDPWDMHAFPVDVPQGVHSIDIEFHFLSATDPGQGRVVATLAMSDLQWFHLALYRRIPRAADCHAPDGAAPGRLELHDTVAGRRAQRRDRLG